MAFGQVVEIGQRVKFRDGKTYIIEKYLGKGSTTAVYRATQLKNGLPHKSGAIRIPLRNGEYKKGFPYVLYINEFIKGYKALEKANVTTPKLIDHSLNEYAFVEEVDFGPTKLDVQTFIINGYESEIYNKEKIEALKKFANQFKDFESVGDFKMDQIIWSPKKREWVLIDWTNEHLPKNIFEPLVNPFVFYIESSLLGNNEADKELKVKLKQLGIIYDDFFEENNILKGLNDDGIKKLFNYRVQNMASRLGIKIAPESDLKKLSSLYKKTSSQFIDELVDNNLYKFFDIKNKTESYLDIRQINELAEKFINKLVETENFDDLKKLIGNLARRQIDLPQALKDELYIKHPDKKVGLDRAFKNPTMGWDSALETCLKGKIIDIKV